MPENIKIIIKQHPFFKGMIRVVDMSSLVIKNHNTPMPYKSDFQAISEDWENVGKDINKAMSDYQKETTHVATA